jgi:hypothetical protein
VGTSIIWPKKKRMPYYHQFIFFHSKDLIPNSLGPKFLLLINIIDRLWSFMVLDPSLNQCWTNIHMYAWVWTPNSNNSIGQEQKLDIEEMVSKNLPWHYNYGTSQILICDGYVKVRESLNSQVIIRVNTILNDIDTRTVLSKYESRYENSCMVYIYPNGIENNYTITYPYLTSVI